ncbi:Head completion/stabilization protein [Neisseria sp. N95_16]|uniref:Head completion/stabilization protein n=1 Tax=Neisseria brasiliensis TaxID=2666100 RepID=A0A5Q3RV81_9NEIS|nr:MULTISPECIES: head completion/stabilization protein [Neisseria]MRN37192.1 Head completion/stabilization protein [Neisseria brasiliensis]PJO10089.1 Head completion/stabilization protein [Neisseria sp. N95_16]PJO78753.1 Head completion/stabilization protein [Neisseria sp. N177_16]QGL24201.1 Head completion/stabilization protein [Neisseria brasiliensis]
MSLVFADTDTQGRQSIGQNEIVSAVFWPRIDLSELRDVMRIDNNINSNRLYHTALESVAHVNGQLKGWRMAAQQRGFTALADVAEEDDKINGEAPQVAHYRRAVYCYTKALMLEKWADADATGKTGERAEAKQQQAEDYRREGHFAVAAIMGQRRCDAELI